MSLICQKLEFVEPVFTRSPHRRNNRLLLGFIEPNSKFLFHI